MLTTSTLGSRLVEKGSPPNQGNSATEAGNAQTLSSRSSTETLEDDFTISGAKVAPLQPSTQSTTTATLTSTLSTPIVGRGSSSLTSSLPRTPRRVEGFEDEILLCDGRADDGRGQQAVVVDNWKSERTPRTSLGSGQRHTIVLEDDEDVYCVDDYPVDEDFENIANTHVTETDAEAPVPHPTRNNPPIHPLTYVESCPFGGMKLIPGKTVELEDGDFLRISAIIAHPDLQDVWLRGWRLRRTKSMHGMLEMKRNELCMILQLDEDDPRDPLEQGAEEIHLSEVQRLRRLVMTNEDWPAHSFTEMVENPDKISDRIVFTEMHLVARWKYIIYFRTQKDRLNLNWTEKLLVKMREDDKGVESRVSDEELRYRWRGVTVKGGSALQEISQEAPMSSREPDTIATPHTRPTLNHAPGGTSICLDDDSTHIDLTLDTTIFASHCASPSARAEKRRVLKNRRSTQRLTLDFKLEEEPRVSIDLSATEEGCDIDAAQSLLTEYGQRRKSSLASGHHLQAFFDTESGSPNSQTRCSGRITSWHSTKNSTKQARPDYLQCPTPPGSSPYSRPSNVMQTDSIPRRSGLREDFDDRAIPINLTRPRKIPTTRKRSADNIEMSPRSQSTLELRPRSADRRLIPAYHFGDCFCGAGGMSCAALLAGLMVAWGFDHDSAAIDSYRLNFLGTRCYLVPADNFISLTDEAFKVDVLHLSPPCQYFSPAHTLEGKDDERNTAALFATTELIKKAKPRVVTMEETSGLIERHQEYFNAALHILTMQGFSVRWKVVNCAEYGLPQARKRLFLIASW